MSYDQGGDGGHEGGGTSLDAGTDQTQLNLRALYFLHTQVAQELTNFEDPQGLFPKALWQVSSVELQSFGELDGKYGEGAFWGVSSFEEMDGHGCFLFMDYRSIAALTMLDEEDFTSDETIVDGIFQNFNMFFGQIWETIYRLSPLMAVFPYAPERDELQEMMKGLNDRTPMLVTAFRVTSPSNETGRVVLAMTDASMFLMQSNLAAVVQNHQMIIDQSHFYQRLELLGALPVPITVILGRTEMTLAELQSLEVDDVIELDHGVGVPLEIEIGRDDKLDAKRFARLYGKPGTTIDGRRRAVQVVRTT